MQLSLREDYLEAIQQFSEKNAHPPHYGELAAALGKPESVVRSDMEDLVSSGDVSLLPGGVISLTGQGQQTGLSVIKKHETLQCFLSEILGMDSSSASDEACTLEHAVSDETIDRLGQLIVKQDGHVAPRARENTGGRIVPQGACRERKNVNIPAFLIVLRGKMSSSTVSMAGHLQNASLILVWYPGSELP